MKTLNNRKWAFVALLSIIVPVGLLTTFRLTGVIKEPPKPETLTVEAVSWNMSRPTKIVTVNESVKNYFTDGKASVGLSVHVAGYRENWPVWPSDGDDDIVDLKIAASCNTSDGFLYSMVVRFSLTDTLTDVDFQRAPSSMELHNLEIKKIRNLGTYDLEAYIETTALNQPKDALLSAIVYCVFLDRNDTNHWVTVSLEATYFNGTAYRKVTVPIVLGVFVG